MAYVETTAPLLASASWVSDTKLTDHRDFLNGTAFSDRSGKLHVQQSLDGTHWDIDTQYTITANTGKSFSETIVAAYWRLVYENDAINQTVLRVQGFAVNTGDE